MNGAWRSGLSRSSPASPSAPQADAQAVAGLLEHWESSLVEIGFLDPQAPKKLMPRLNQLFNRAQVTQDEVHILRGVAKAMAQNPLPRQGDRLAACFRDSAPTSSAFLTVTRLRAAPGR